MTRDVKKEKKGPGKTGAIMHPSWFSLLDASSPGSSNGRRRGAYPAGRRKSERVGAKPRTPLLS